MVADGEDSKLNWTDLVGEVLGKKQTYLQRNTTNRRKGLGSTELGYVKKLYV
jgi:hypothetical protein